MTKSRGACLDFRWRIITLRFAWDWAFCVWLMLALENAMVSAFFRPRTPASLKATQSIPNKTYKKRRLLLRCAFWKNQINLSTFRPLFLLVNPKLVIQLSSPTREAKLTADRGSSIMSATKLHKILDPVCASVLHGRASGMTYKSL